MLTLIFLTQLTPHGQFRSLLLQPQSMLCELAGKKKVLQRDGLLSRVALVRGTDRDSAFERIRGTISIERAKDSRESARQDAAHGVVIKWGCFHENGSRFVDERDMHGRDGVLRG